MASQTGIVQQLLQDIVIPRVVKIRQDFERPVVHDLEAALLERLHTARVLAPVQPGMSIAVGVGSRGISNQTLVVRTLIRELKAKGDEPCIFPAMGSHGGATADGQQNLLVAHRHNRTGHRSAHSRHHGHGGDRDGRKRAHGLGRRLCLRRRTASCW